MYNGHIIKKRSATNTSPCSLYRQGGGCLGYFLREPPFCLLRRGVVFLFSSTFFRKKYALTSRTIPFRTSRKISRKGSRYITSFPNKRQRRSTTGHPHNIQLQLYSIIDQLSKNLSIFDKNRGVTGTEI